MKQQALIVRIALAALLAGLVQACATPSEQAQYERATGQRVPVSGSRIPRTVDPKTGAPQTEYPLESYTSDRARAEVEAMRETQQRMRRNGR